MALEDDELLGNNEIWGYYQAPQIKPGHDAWEIAAFVVSDLVGWNKDKIKELSFQTNYCKDGPYGYPYEPHRIRTTILHSISDGSDRTDQFNFSRDKFIRTWAKFEVLLNKIVAY